MIEEHIEARDVRVGDVISFSAHLSAYDNVTVVNVTNVRIELAEPIAGGLPAVVWLPPGHRVVRTT